MRKNSKFFKGHLPNQFRLLFAESLFKLHLARNAHRLKGHGSTEVARNFLEGTVLQQASKQQVACLKKCHVFRVNNFTLR